MMIAKEFDRLYARWKGWLKACFRKAAVCDWNDKLLPGKQ
jgi:hypothetical protein